MRSHGPGFRFQPTNEELIMYYLTRKVTRRRFHHDGIRVLDVYNFAPWDLEGQARWKGNLKYYFFCPRERKYLTGKRMKRATTHGSWKTTGEDRKVLYNGETVGMIKSLVFHTLNPKKRTNWVMHEYKLQDEYLKKLGLQEDLFVLCVIFEKEDLGPRNGAQYGCPYRDEDWDDDGDCDTDDELDNRGEGTNVVGALTRVHTDRGKSTVCYDFERADGFCVGSSSWTLLSDVDQSVNHGFPPTPVPRTLFMNSQLPLSDECGMFIDEIPSVSLENEQAQDIDVDGDINCEPSIPADDNIFNNLEDICSLYDFADSDVGAHGCDFLANQNIQPDDDYLELLDCMDVSCPFEGSHHHDHSSPGQPSPSFGPMIPEGIPVSILVDQQNLNVRISSSMLSWNGHLQEPAETERPINGPQFAEDSVGLNVQGFEENESHMNQHYQTSYGSIGFNGQEASINGQVDHLSTVWEQNDPFGIMQLP